MINKSKSVKDSFAYSVLAVEDKINKKKNKKKKTICADSGPPPGM